MQKHYIKAWRKERKLSQTQLCDRMEIEPGVRFMSVSNLSNIETFKQSPTLEQLQAIALALDVTVNMLIEHNPAKEGEVVDFLRRLDEREYQRVVAVMRAAAGGQ